MNLAITVAFTAVTATRTSYPIMTKYPRFIEITGARDIIVQESHVRVEADKVNRPEK